MHHRFINGVAEAAALELRLRSSSTLRRHEGWTPPRATRWFRVALRFLCFGFPSSLPRLHVHALTHVFCFSVPFFFFFCSCFSGPAQQSICAFRCTILKLGEGVLCDFGEFWVLDGLWFWPGFKMRNAVYSIGKIIRCYFWSKGTGLMQGVWFECPLQVFWGA